MQEEAAQGRKRASGEIQIKIKESKREKENGWMDRLDRWIEKRERKLSGNQAWDLKLQAASSSRECIYI